MAGNEEPGKELESAALLSTVSRDWNPDRVARHLERAAAQAYQALRRARWLALLHDSDILYLEPGSARARLLIVRDGAVVDAVDGGPERVPRVRLQRTRNPRFDRAKYDRLRILSSELKRIAQDGGQVAVDWGAARAVSQRWLSGILRVV